ncbi:GNAT family N-acetyltransferase [Limoniibacter endophyticus]|uniref:BioF2-like acetyltransferase domain-containing protein n=1 Tax=Limoniibacter endophyticus TaxID=1565040 RepID=A0A8J3DR96_9HYPH|nr:GNAT family N-acetyltransferase [Limoniibacter endophyticus]GHC76206.1 hypothetical protein GCM10010136_26690 [Limoniibacter endophyticus]
MAAKPLLEELSNAPAGRVVNHDMQHKGAVHVAPSQSEPRSRNQQERKLAIYPAAAGYDLVDELDYLCARAIEPNVFFNPRFLAPAMPRLQSKEIRLAVIRDRNDDRNRLRMLVPFSVERHFSILGQSYLRSWATPFGPLGIPLIDCDDPVSVVEDFLAIIGRPRLKLPDVFVFPRMRLKGAASNVIQAACKRLDLPFLLTDVTSRACLNSDLESSDYLKSHVSAHHRGEWRRLRRRLSEAGTLEYHLFRSREDIRRETEAFLTLEASGWKGRMRTAMVIDRLQAAFAREAIHRLAERDLCRIHALKLNGRTIASLVVFIENGVAYTWKTAYDEDYAAYSPGALLMVEATRTHLEDPNILMTDSCAFAENKLMNKVWKERIEIGTIMIGLHPSSNKKVARVAREIRNDTRYRFAMKRLRHRLN